MKNYRNSRRGNTIVEMALVVVPLIFFLLSTIEVARGLWSYSTLAGAVKHGVRYLVVHGGRCVDVGNNCRATIGDAAQLIVRTGVGLDSTKMQLTFVSGGQTYSCATASGCAQDATAWPPSGANAPGMLLTVTGKYTFQSALGFLWPGQTAGSFDFSAKSTEMVEF